MRGVQVLDGDGTEAGRESQAQRALPVVQKCIKTVVGWGGLVGPIDERNELALARLADNHRRFAKPDAWRRLLNPKDRYVRQVVSDIARIATSDFADFGLLRTEATIQLNLLDKALRPLR